MPAHVRPIRPDDADGLRRFHESQSEQSRYFRFFAPVKSLSARELRMLTDVDHVNRVALVAVRPSTDPDLPPGTDDIIGVARYDVQEENGAGNVAFSVSDALQGKGLGSVLLEHLMSAARERAIQRFAADVLPENAAMLAVFREAGFDMLQELEDGIVAVSLDLDPTEKSRAVMADREHRAEARSMQALLSARKVLLIGPGPADMYAAPDSYSYVVGYTVDRAARWQSVQLARRVMESQASDPGDTELYVIDAPAWPGGEALIPESPHIHHVTGWDNLPQVDLIMLACEASWSIEALRRAANTGARGVIVLTEGFAEAGADGAALQRELVRTAHVHGMRLIGPSSFGLVTTTPGNRVRASLSQQIPSQVGHLGLFCHSSASAVITASTMARRRLYPSVAISTGYRADVSGTDLMQYWLADDDTTVVCLYMEAISNPRKFIRVARRLSAKKPVIAVVAGQSEIIDIPGQMLRATQVTRATLDEVLRQAGVLRVHNTHELLDVGQLFASQPLPTGRRVGILASSAALVALITEACKAAGLEVASASAYLAVERRRADVERAVGALYAPDACDAVIVADVPVITPNSDIVTSTVAQAAARTGRTTVVASVGLHGLPVELAAPDPDGNLVHVPAFSTPEDAVSALGHVINYVTWRGRNHGAYSRPHGIDRVQARRIVANLLSGKPQPGIISADTQGALVLDDGVTATLLGCYGLKPWPTRHVTTVDQALDAAEELGWPVVLKSSYRALRHRLELGGVRTDIDDADELADAVHRMTAVAEDAGIRPGFEVQAMAPQGVPCVVRSIEDPLFGPVVSFGIAGDAVELLGDVAYAIAPLTDVDIHDLIRTVRAAPRLFGYQGAPTCDVAALEDLVARVACLADDVPEVASLELYPVLVSPQGLSILGARMRLRPAVERRDPLRRVLPA
ncbi:MAG: GNAT family N-acetyltransferase [Cellulomonadaceae bacterium]|nr:GNAT family N-acetyltransferase [Cellulomonadaceae bacterium]